MTDEQIAAFKQLRHLGMPLRLRVIPDGEGYPVVRGRLGDIEWHHAEGTHLAAYTAGNKARLGRLLSLPSITRHQVADTECRILFPVSMLREVAGAIKARRRKQITPEHLAKLRGALLRGGAGGETARSTEGAATLPIPDA